MQTQELLVNFYLFQPLSDVCQQLIDGKGIKMLQASNNQYSNQYDSTLLQKLLLPQWT